MYPTKTKVVTAAQNKHQHNLSHTHLTTAGFMQGIVPFCYEAIPDSVIKVKPQTFVRLNPMKLPTMGRIRVRNHFFFVPLRVVWRPWNAFLAEVPHAFNNTVTVPSRVPVIDNCELVDLFKNFSSVSTLVADEASFIPQSDHAYDFVTFLNGTGTNPSRYRFYRLTTRGRYYYKILSQLGYKPNFDQNSGKVSYSALPLLSLAKLYYDYYENSAYINSERLDNVRLLLENNDEVLSLTSYNLDVLLEMFLVFNYASDPFVSAWDNPAGPNAIGNSVTIYDNTLPGNAYKVSDDNGYGTAVAAPSSGNQTFGTTGLSQNAVNLLHQMSDHLKRNQVVGGREIDRILAEYGVKLSSAESNRVVDCGYDDFYVNIGDVMSQSDTDGASLGAYAGRGQAFNQGVKEFTIKTGHDFGYIFCITSVTPDVGYYQGIRRHVLHKTRYDFFTPEYDALGVQAVSQAEVIMPMTFFRHGNDSLQYLNYGDLTQKVFGFVPRYSEYKYMYNTISGDFACNSVNADLQAWHLMRYFDPYYYTDIESVTGTLNITHSRAFMCSYDSGSYNRIFYDASGVDNFNLFFNMEVHASLPAKSIYDDYDYDSAGDTIIMELNGKHEN